MAGKRISEIADDEVVWVGMSDGGEADKAHFICIWGHTKQETHDWCLELTKKYPDSDHLPVKMTGKMLRAYMDR